MNIFFTGLAPHFVEALKRVADETGVIPSFMVTVDTSDERYYKRGYDRALALFPDTSFFNQSRLQKGDLEYLRHMLNPACLSMEPLSPAFHSRFAHERLMVMENIVERSLVQRFAKDKTVRELTNDYFVIGYNLVDTFRPSLIIHEVAPHDGWNLALYYCARARGIPNLLFADSCIPCCSVGMRDFMHPRPFASLSLSDQVYRAEKERLFHSGIKGIKEGVLPYYMQTDARLVATKPKGKESRNKVRFRRSFFSVLVFAFLEPLHALGKELKKFKSGNVKEEAHQNRIRTAMDQRQQRNVFKRLRGKFTNFFRFTVVNYRLERFYHRKTKPFQSFIKASHGVQFVYAPLSLRPERTTLPCAGFMFDQLTYLGLVAASLPEGWKIVVKENPKQFSNRYPFSPKNKAFYDEIERLGILMAPIDFDTHELMRRSRAVVITTGSAGFEAVVAHGKPVLGFSDSWYEGLPGVSQARTSEDVENFFRDLTEGTMSIRSEDIDAYLVQLRDGMIYFSPDGKTVLDNVANGWDPSAMSANLAALIKAELGIVDRSAKM